MWTDNETAQDFLNFGGILKLLPKSLSKLSHDRSLLAFLVPGVSESHQ